MHAHAMPCATPPAVTQASPILLGCRVLDGQAISGEHLHDGGLRAGQVAVERPESLSFFHTSIVDPNKPAKSKDILVTALIHSFT